MESELYVYVYIVSIVLVIYTSLFLQFLAICFTNVSFDSTSSILAPQKHIARIRAANSTSLVVVEAAVMLEANWQDLVQSLLVVAVEQTEALRRHVFVTLFLKLKPMSASILRLTMPVALPKLSM